MRQPETVYTKQVNSTNTIATGTGNAVVAKRYCDTYCKILPPSLKYYCYFAFCRMLSNIHSFIGPNKQNNNVVYI